MFDGRGLQGRNVPGQGEMAAAPKEVRVAQIASPAVTEDQRRLGVRLLAFAALWVLLSGLLLVLSFVVLAVISFALLFLAALVIGGRWTLQYFSVGEKAAAALVTSTDTVARQARRVHRPRPQIRPRVSRIGGSVSTRTRLALVRAPSVLESVLQAYARAVHRLSAVGRRRRAIQLNERGAQLRRRGDPVHAAEQHRVALEIVRDLGDEQAEALTLNSLGLALAQGGAEEEAVEHFEQARHVLHQIGDEVHEGQVIANLGLVYRRQGESEQASVLFQQALDRLPPDSPAYRHVMEELLRAS
jgi:tetratricopeptide (TPR) repeat protein